MRILLDSSNICEVVYYRPQGILEVVFHGGRVYRYAGITEAVFQEFITAESAGKYYNAKIKRQFKSARWH